MKKRNVAVIGGGASGMVAALEAAKNGAKVTIYEHTDRLGKKILSTGNGKCNLSNTHMSEACFYSHCMERVKKSLSRFSTEDTIKFFESLGLCIKEKNGYLYPLAEQAAVVLDVLRFAVEQYGIEVVYHSKIKNIYTVTDAEQDTCICVENGEKKTFYHRVIIACGSKAAPKTGSDGSGYDLAKKMGHKIVPVLPSLVQLRCRDTFCKSIAGIRAEAVIHILADGKLLCLEKGELQLTDYGISGIPVFQLSGVVNRYLEETLKTNKKDTVPSGQISGTEGLIAKIDFLPDMEETSFEKLICERCKDISAVKGRTVEEFFTGVLNKKLMMLLIKQAGLLPNAEVSKVSVFQLKKVFALCRGLEMHIVGSNGFENAQVCTGGVDLNEVTDALESKKVKGVYFAGEILDVDGRCGGYNLQWAWTSGVIAGRAAAGVKGY